jgi:hypothetical protein
MNVPVSNFGLQTGYSDAFRGFSQSLQANFLTVTYVRPGTVPLTYVVIHHSLVLVVRRYVISHI